VTAYGNSPGGDSGAARRDSDQTDPSLATIPDHEQTGPLPPEVQARLNRAVAVRLLRRYFGDDVTIEGTP
jgi:hypothetical protein